MKEPWQLMTTRTISLDHEQLLILEGRPGTRVKVLFGDVWLTEESESRDHFLKSGEEVSLQSGKRTVIEPLAPTHLQIEDPVQRGSWRRWLDALQLRLRPLAA
jgi:hypothetical protein